MPNDRLFGSEWYQFTPYLRALPKRKVVSRVNDPAGTTFFTEELECGHTVRITPVSHRGSRAFPVRHCTACPPEPPCVQGVEVIIDDVVPYEPGHPRKKGWCWVGDPVRKVPSIEKTKYLLVHPDFHPLVLAGQEKYRAMNNGYQKKWRSQNRWKFNHSVRERRRRKKEGKQNG